MGSFTLPLKMAAVSRFVSATDEEEVYWLGTHGHRERMQSPLLLLLRKQTMLACMQTRDVTLHASEVHARAHLGERAGAATCAQKRRQRSC